MREKIADFCWRWGMVFGAVGLAIYVATGVAMHYAVLRFIWKWL